MQKVNIVTGAIFALYCSTIIANTVNALTVMLPPPLTNFHHTQSLGPSTYSVVGNLTHHHLYDSCNYSTPSVTNKIVLSLRGGCFFYTNAIRAQAAGALAIIVGNNDYSQEYLCMGMPPEGEVNGPINIPIVSVNRIQYDFLLHRLLEASFVEISLNNADNNGVCSSSPSSSRSSESSGPSAGMMVMAMILIVGCFGLMMWVVRERQRTLLLAQRTAEAAAAMETLRQQLPTASPLSDPQTVVAAVANTAGAGAEDEQLINNLDGAMPPAPPPPSPAVEMAETGAVAVNVEQLNLASGGQGEALLEGTEDGTHYEPDGSPNSDGFVSLKKTDDDGI